MSTQHQPNAAMQETKPAPSPAPEAPKPAASSGHWEFLILFMLISFFVFLILLIGGKLPDIYFQEPKCVLGICIDLPSLNRR